jgi:O-methyltransferase involved in polyketide biosynthesis
VLRDPSAFVGTARLFASLERFGEAWTFGIEPGELPSFLSDRGMSLERDLGASEYREIYFKEAARAMRGYEFYRIAVARVRAQAAQPDATRSRAS